ncbi:hypothetical protein TWF696_007962 [Orbilia brochopaga]|uniref:Pyrroloquinoline quinone-dependent pyranose dehydrogenase beta-propeller domain-containing protein n=1 Tax=Orbilia brochopaga TaxID=3140254 RepID=A0AAV9ULT5_9PEZI
MTPDGKTLFASSSTTAFAWTYDPRTGKATGKATIVTGMPQGGHSTRSLLVPKANPDLLLISVGSDGNLDDNTKDYSYGRSQIRGFLWKDLLSNSITFTDSNINFGWGLRNSVGIRDDSKGQLWSVENSADNIHRYDVDTGDNVDVHNDNPAEELNFHGSVEDTTTARGNYGYPVCFAAWDTELPNWTSPPGQQFSLNPSEISDETCAADYQAPSLGFPAHSAPLDIVFDANGDAWVTFHGSWNRSPPTGYKLVRIAFDPETSRPIAASSSLTGFVSIMSNADVNACGEAGKCFRPTSLAVHSDGSLFMSSDATGEIYRIQKTGS